MYPAEIFRDSLSRLIGILCAFEVRFHRTEREELDRFAGLLGLGKLLS